MEQKVATSIGIEQIKEILPHREPFLMVDRVDELVPGKSAKCVKAVSGNEWYFLGHFAQKKVMPGVLIVEAMAQTGAVLMSKTLNVDRAGKTILFTSVDNCRFRQPVRPGDVLRMHVKVLRARGGLFKFEGKAMVGDKTAAEAEFAAMLVETP